jgi:hypothetical protein
MLAYVFWHWRRFGVQSRDYEAHLVNFHRALNQSPPAGFSWSACLAISNGSWANDGKDAYEDWYLINDSGALDALNDAAVSASRKAPHDAAAAVAADGAGGLYRARSGVPTTTPKHAHWFGKPDGWSYAKLHDVLSPFTAPRDRVLWQRQMVLGPAREFCLQSSEPLTFPPGIVAQLMPLRTVFPDGA